MMRLKMKILYVGGTPDRRAEFESFLRSSAAFKEAEVATARLKGESLKELEEPAKSAACDIVLLDLDGGSYDLSAASCSYPGLIGGRIPILAVLDRENGKDWDQAFFPGTGIWDAVARPFHAGELAVRLMAALRMRREIERRETCESRLNETQALLAQANKVLNDLGGWDEISGVLSRRRFDEVFDTEWRRAQRETENLSLLLASVDYFNRFTEIYGLQAGSECLKQVARELKRVAKRPGDIVARYSGANFAILLPKTGIDGAVTVGDMARSAVEALAVPHDGSEVASVVTLSVGAASVIPSPFMVPHNLVDAADKALFQAKREGRNRVSYSLLFAD